MTAFVAKRNFMGVFVQTFAVRTLLLP